MERYTTGTYVPVDVSTTCEHTAIKKCTTIREPFQRSQLVLTQKQITQKVLIPCKFHVYGVFLRTSKHSIYYIHRGHTTRSTCFYIFVYYYNSIIRVIVLFYYESLN